MTLSLKQISYLLSRANSVHVDALSLSSVRIGFSLIESIVRCFVCNIASCTEN